MSATTEDAFASYACVQAGARAEAPDDGFEGNRLPVTLTGMAVVLATSSLWGVAALAARYALHTWRGF